MVNIFRVLKAARGQLALERLKSSDCLCFWGEIDSTSYNSTNKKLAMKKCDLRLLPNFCY